jgi:hypothetical protein
MLLPLSACAQRHGTPDIEYLSIDTKLKVSKGNCMVELFTADQAAPVFMHYVEHQTVPDGYTLRLIADT